MNSITFLLAQEKHKHYSHHTTSHTPAYHPLDTSVGYGQITELSHKLTHPTPQKSTPLHLTRHTTLFC